MSQDMILLISLLAGIVVCAFELRFLVFKGRSRNQRVVEKRKAKGCVTIGKMKDFKAVYGNGEDKGKEIGKDLYYVTYTYMVQGKTYKRTLCFESNDFPVEVTIYYDPNNPKKSLAANEATRAEQIQHGCLITVVSTILVIGIVGNLLMKLF